MKTKTYSKEYYQMNKDKIRDSHRRYYLKNRGDIRKKNKIHYQNHRLVYSKKQSKRNLKNKSITELKRLLNKIIKRTKIILEEIKRR